MWRRVILPGQWLCRRGSSKGGGKDGGKGDKGDKDGTDGADDSEDSSEMFGGKDADLKEMGTWKKQRPRMQEGKSSDEENKAFRDASHERNITWDPIEAVPTLAETALLDKPTVLPGEKQPKTSWSDDSFVVNLFRGIMQVKQVFPYSSVLTPKQDRTLQACVSDLEDYMTEKNDPKKHDIEARIEPAEIAQFHRLGLFRMGIPVANGGLGFNHTQNARIIQSIGMHDLSVAGLVSGHQCLGYKAIKLFGTPEQKERFYHQIVVERKLACFALTEPYAESDVASIMTRATLSGDGSHYIINGVKSAVINGTFADLITVFALTESASKELEITAFIVERSVGGVSVGKAHAKMGMCATDQVSMVFKDVKVPKENMIGQPGEGYRIAMHVLNHSRFGTAACLSGTMRVLITKSVEYATQRRQFGRKINTFGAIQGKLARMAMKQYVAECLTYMIAGNMDRGYIDFYIESAISKCFAAKAAWDVVDDALQIFGGSGYLEEVGMERLLRDIRYFRIFNGTNDVLRLYVALTGVQHAGVDIDDLQAAYKNPSIHLGLIFGSAKRKSETLHGHYHGMSPSIVHLVHPLLHDAARLATQSIAKFGVVVQVLLERYGREFVEKQYQLIHLANAAIQTYAMVVTLARCTNSLYLRLPSAEHELTLTESFCMASAGKVRVILDHLERNAHYEIGLQLETLMGALSKAGGCVNVGPIGF